MSAGRIHDTRSAPATPPMHPGAMPVLERRSIWPTVIGVMAVVLGALAILGNLWELATPWVLGVARDMIPPGQATGIEVVGEWTWWTATNALLGIGLAVLLLFAGIGLAKRRVWAVRACAAWAILKIMLVAVDSFFVYRIEQAAFESIMPQMPAVPGVGPGFFTAASVFGVIFSMAWGWTFPVFCLVWLSRARVKAEVAGWS